MEEEEKNRRRHLSEAEEDGLDPDVGKPDHPPRWPQTEELRESLTQEIRDAMADEQFILIPAPTSSGKSYNGATTRWRELPVTGEKPVVHFHFTTDSREEAVEDSIEAGIEYRELLGRDEACPVAAGEHDDEVVTPGNQDASEWIQRQCDLKGNALSDVHSHLERENGGELPCTPCPSSNQWEDVPYDTDGNVSADVIHATHAFAYVPTLIDEANLFFDEQPDFKTSVGEHRSDDISFGRFQDIVTAWLRETDAPVPDWETLVTRSKEAGNDELEAYFDSEPSVDDDWFITEPRAHRLAPGLTEAVYRALSSEADNNGRRVGRAINRSVEQDEDNDWSNYDESDDKDPRFGRTRITLVYNETNRSLVFWNVPELDIARSIIGLDAWPSVHEWKQNVGEELEVLEIVPKDEFEQWRRFERGLEVVQIGEGVRQASSDHAVREYTNPDAQQAVIESLRKKYEEEFQSIIFPDKLEDQIVAFLDDDVEYISLGNVKSNNSFATERVGLVTNSIDPGDDYVLDLLAARGLDAEPELELCPNCSGDGCNQCNKGLRRSRGRAFVGPDQDAAAKILDDVRNHKTAQAVGRWARETDGPRAAVFVRTSTAPDEMIDKRISKAWTFTDEQRAVVKQLTLTEGLSVKQAADGAGVSKEAARTTLDRLVEEYGVVTCIRHVGDSGAHLYVLDREIPDHGILNIFQGV